MPSLLGNRSPRRSDLVAEMSENLYLEFCGEGITLSRSEVLTFGRCGDLVIDENPYMHRIVGRFFNVEGVWWLENRSKRQPMEVRDLSCASSVTIAPRRSSALHFGEFSCTFASGPTLYELTGALESFEWTDDLLGESSVDAIATMDWGQVELNEDQQRLLLVLTEQYLLNPAYPDAPMITNRQAALNLGWSITKFNRKLDHLCEKLSRAGVAGLHGDVGGNAIDRRRRLIDHALTAPLVSLEDLPHVA